MSQSLPTFITPPRPPPPHHLDPRLFTSPPTLGEAPLNASISLHGQNVYVSVTIKEWFTNGARNIVGSKYPPNNSTNTYLLHCQTTRSIFYIVACLSVFPATWAALMGGKPASHIWVTVTKKWKVVDGREVIFSGSLVLSFALRRLWKEGWKTNHVIVNALLWLIIIIIIIIFITIIIIIIIVIFIIRKRLMILLSLFGCKHFCIVTH